MEKFSLIMKVLLSTFCLVIILFNLIQVLNATEEECNNGTAEECIIIANWDCEEYCDALKGEECDYIQFVSGSCNYGTCDQWWDYYCESGFLDTYLIVCFSDCPIK